jgi:hypothetical protein
MYAQPGTPFFPGPRGVFITLLDRDSVATAFVVVEVNSIVEWKGHVVIVLDSTTAMLVVVVGMVVTNVEVEVASE